MPNVNGLDYSNASDLIPPHDPSGEQSTLLAEPYEAYRPGPRSDTSPQPSPEPSPQFTPPAARGPAPSPGPFTPPAWGLEPDIDSTHFLQSSSMSLGIKTSPRRKRQNLIIGSAFPTTAAIVELLMLLYFADVYLSLPLTTSGSRPRISPVYSIWPYISCIGSITEVSYRIFSFLYVFFFIGTFVWDLWLNYDAPHGYLLRWLRLLASIIAGSLLIALVFVSINDMTHLHLYLASVRQISAFLVKALTWMIDHLQRKRYPVIRQDGIDRISKRWKHIVLAGAVLIAVLAPIGIYACQNSVDSQTPGTTCYVLVAISAISDWTYEALNVSFNLCLALDLYQSEHFARLRTRSQRAQRWVKDKDGMYQSMPYIRCPEVELEYNGNSAMTVSF